MALPRVTIGTWTTWKYGMALPQAAALCLPRRTYAFVEVKHAISLLVSLLIGMVAFNSFAQECPSNWKTLHPAWIWCDDFEQNKLSSYFDTSDQGPFARSAGVGLNGSFGMRATWAAGVENAGSVKLAFGLTPGGGGFTVPAGVDSTTKFREIYYRAYLRSQPGWVS